MNHSQISIGRSFRTRWKQERSTRSRWAASLKFFQLCWEFVRDSLPERRRRLYGDVEYDWEFRVNTTSAALPWRTRLLGLLHSPYQPVDPELFREMLNSLAIDFTLFTFLDVGSGKGRALLLAAEYPFRRVVGVELLPDLNAIAEENIRRFPSEKRACQEVQALCGDATEFDFPGGPLVVFLFNPLPEDGLSELVRNLDASLRKTPREAYVIYANPVLEKILCNLSTLVKSGGTHQYSVFHTAK